MEQFGFFRKKLFVAAAAMALAVAGVFVVGTRAGAAATETVTIDDMDVSTIKSAIENKLAISDCTTVTVIGTETDVSETLVIIIPSGKTVVWKATYSTISDINLITVGGNGTFEVAENSSISTTTGYAICASGASSTVKVSGGTVSTTAGVGIYANGASSTVNVSGGTVSATTGTAIYASGTSSIVNVSGGMVEATGNNGWAITAYGNVEVSGNAQVSTTTGRAIYASGTSPIVTVSGGIVSTTTGRAIYASGTSPIVTVSGGIVSTTTGTAIYAASTNSTVAVTGGLVFAYGTDIIGVNNVIHSNNTAANAITITSPGIVIAWNKSAGITTYAIDSNNDIIVSPTGSTTVWDKQNVDGVLKSGIAYANGVNTGFIPIDGITVSKTYTVTFNLNGGTLATGTLVQTVEEGDSAIAPTATKDGYTFDDWDKAFNNITSDITITAKWKVNGSGGGSTGGYTPSTPVSITEINAYVKKVDDKVEIPLTNGAKTVTYNGTTLVSSKDYTIEDGKLIISKSKLKELGEVSTTAKITVVDISGATLKYTIKVTDTPRISTPITSGNSLIFNFAGYGNELRTITLSSGETLLKEFRIVADFNVKDGKFSLSLSAISALADGTYTLTATFDTGEEVVFTIIKKGDKIQFINADLVKFSLIGNSKPNTADCLKMLDISVGKQSYKGENLDFNADGEYNTLDVLALLDFVVLG